MKPEYEPSNFYQALGYFVEECGEALAAAGKTQRWGAFSVNPELPPEMQEANWQWLMREIHDVETAIERVRRFLPRAPTVRGLDDPSDTGPLPYEAPRPLP